MELRDYQQSGIDNIRATLQGGVRRLVVQAATGAGKTKIASAIVQMALQKGKRVAFVVPAISLIDQTVESFYADGITDIGVIQAQHILTDWARPVQVCSVQTLASKKAYPQADLVIFDECHRLHEAHKEWMGDAEWARVPFIGLSATPWARGLGKYFESLLVIATTQELIDRGYLSPFRVFATGHPDLSGVKTMAGDYHEGELSGAMRAGELTADIVKTWVAKWNKDKTLCFAVDRAHAAHIQERFTAAGIECGYQDALTKDDERREIKRKFHNGEYPVVVNIGTLTTGVDWDVRCIILARPTKSEMLYVQIIGRGLRTAEGKESALILDHSDTTERLGFVTDIHHDELDVGRPKDKAKAKERKTPLPRECKACSCLIPAGAKNCPECGAETKRETGIIERHGELLELVPGMALKKQAKKEMSAEDRERFYYELLGYADERGYKSGWAGNQYRERFGTWPPNFWGKNPIAPGLTTRSWIKSRMIAWAKSKRRAELHSSP
jgi:superfamily II DNA or RNA helicase